MSGTKYLFDTNTLINFFKGAIELQKFSQSPIALSVISVIEFLSFPKLEDDHKLLFEEFLKTAEVINVEESNSELLQKIITVRSTYKLKLPDAIIVATALYTGAQLVSNDQQLFKCDALTYHIEPH